MAGVGMGLPAGKSCAAGATVLILHAAYMVNAGRQSSSVSAASSAMVLGSCWSRFYEWFT